MCEKSEQICEGQGVEPAAFRVCHGGGATVWAKRADAEHNASATGGVVVPPFEGHMSAAEQAVMDRLVEAWNLFVALPVEHPDDASEFRHAFHGLQCQLLARPARRAMNSEGVAS